MTAATLPAPIAAAPARTGEVDSRAAYTSFALAYVLGHGAAAVSRGEDPLLALPGWLPVTILAAGLAAGSGYSALAAARSQRGASKSDLLSGRMLGLSWISGFVALFLAITGLSSILDNPDLQTVLWPAGSGLVVGLVYLAEGAARRNVLHYCLGTWLALVSTAALALGTGGLFWALAIAGGGGCAVAAHLERFRLGARSA